MPLFFVLRDWRLPGQPSYSQMLRAGHSREDYLLTCQALLEDEGHKLCVIKMPVVLKDVCGHSEAWCPSNHNECGRHNGKSHSLCPQSSWALGTAVPIPQLTVQVRRRSWFTDSQAFICCSPSSGCQAAAADHLTGWWAFSRHRVCRKEWLGFHQAGVMEVTYALQKAGWGRGVAGGTT